MKGLRIERTLRIITIVPFNDQYYPDQTIEQAIDYEREPELSDAIELMVQETNSAEFNMMHIPTMRIPTGEFTSMVTVVDIDDSEAAEAITSDAWNNASGMPPSERIGSRSTTDDELLA